MSIEANPKRRTRRNPFCGRSRAALRRVFCVFKKNSEKRENVIEKVDKSLTTGEDRSILE
jgi:hypothetical protein